MTDTPHARVPEMTAWLRTHGDPGTGQRWFFVDAASAAAMDFLASWRPQRCDQSWATDLW